MFSCGGSISPWLHHCHRQREEEEANIGAHHLEARAQFEEDLQSLQASIDAEFGKDSDSGGRCSESLICWVLVM